jgi:hypothetical protein
MVAIGLKEAQVHTNRYGLCGVCGSGYPSSETAPHVYEGSYQSLGHGRDICSQSAQKE